MPHLPRLIADSAYSPFGRFFCRYVAWALLAVVLFGSAHVQAAGACSPYVGKVEINELRIGSSGSRARSTNQVELFNGDNVASTIWRSWSIKVLYQSSIGGSVNTYNYPLSVNSSFTNVGQFIYNNNKSMVLRNRSGRTTQVVLVDVNGDFIDEVAIGGRSQTMPTCLTNAGATKLVSASGSNDTNANFSRQTDGGAWPGALQVTTAHTIGRTNNCTLGAPDLTVSITADNTTPLVSDTTVTYTVTISNVSCANSASSVVLSVSNMSTTYYTSNPNISAGSLSGGKVVWSIGNMAVGATSTLVISGIPKTVGLLSSDASFTTSTTGLVNTSNDTDTETIDVKDYNYVGFDNLTDAIVEGVDNTYLVSVSSNVISSKNITVNYTVAVVNAATGAAISGAISPTSGSVTIDPQDPNSPTQSNLSFTISNDAVNTGDKRITITISSVSSQDRSVRLDPAANAMVVTLQDDDPLGPDHYELSVPTSSLSCLATTITVTACATSGKPCTSIYTAASGGTVTLATPTSGAALGSTTLTFDATGVATTTLSYPSATNGAAAAVNLSSVSKAATNAVPYQCCQGGSCTAYAANSCSTTFNTAGLIFSGAAGGASANLATQTAGSSSATYYLRAVKTGTASQACESALTGAQSVNFGYQCNNPSTCAGSNLMAINGGSSTTISRNNNGVSSSSSAVSMTFDANGNAPFTLNFSDVGQVTLFANKSVGGASLSGISNAFVVKPFGFELSAIAQTASPNTANPAAASGSGTKFVKADEAFSVTVTARTATGAAAPNYGKETSPEGVKLTAALVLPSGGAIPALNNASSFGAFSSGVATGTSFSWSEVGIITLTPSVADADYLGVGNVTGTTSGNVGRFVPDHFDTVVTQGCSAGAFTYSGQPFGVQVNAMNGKATPTATSNYAGLFARNIALSEVNGLAGSLSGTVILSSAFTAGQASSSTPTFSFSNSATLPSSAKLRAVDADGISSLRAVAASSVEGLAAIRSGRIQLSNANGSDLLPLPITARVQNYTSNGGVSGWFTSTVDTSCSTLSASNFAVTFPASSATYTNNLTACTTGVSTADFSGTPPSYTVKLKRPGAGKRGWADLSLNLGASAAGTACTCTGTSSAATCSAAAATTANKPWLQFNWTGSAGNPGARATFGVTTSGPTIHMRELY